MGNRRIIHVITTIERGGAENAVATLAIAQVRAGHNVYIFPLKGRKELLDHLTENGVRVLLGGLNASPFRQALLLRKLYAKDLIFHAHLPRAEVLSRIALGAGKYVITRHNAEPFFPKAPLGFSRVISRWVTRRVTVIAISNSVVQFLKVSQEISRFGRCVIIYYGYEPKLKSSVVSNKVKIAATNLLHIGTVSRLAKQKNLKLLIHLTKSLSDKGFNVQTSILGEGPLEKELRILTRNLQIGDRVSFLGKSNDVIAFISTLDLFLLTSNYEGFGLVLLEAMDANIPIVASNVSAIPEVLGENHPGLFECGSLENLEAKVIEFTKSHKAKKRSLVYQKKRLLQFSIEQYFTNHEQVYDSLLSS